MASVVSFSNVHQLSTSDKLCGVVDFNDKKNKSPVKMMQASPDSTNNNSTSMSNNNTTTYTSAPTPVPSRGRGRKSTTTFVQVIPGQPVAVARRNARERNRVKQVNNGFSNLRQHIPFSARNKKMSKVETLKCAVDYIRSLQRLLDENGGYDGGDLHLDLSHNVSSSSPMSSLDSGEDHSLMSMGNSDIMYEAQTDTVPSSSTIMVDEYTPAVEYRHTTVLPSRLYANDDVVFDDSPLPSHPHSLIRHGSSLSPGYSDRSSVNNSPAEVTTTGFMGVFAAAAAGLDKSAAAMMDLSRSAISFKKERDDEATSTEGGAALLELEGSSEMMEALTWWEIEQARRIQQQQTS
ncbi:hypothetical protein B566_EDAN002795 [Ephemera danica]|nr:hypothetical protein B566_EDAN002795 [Ephemera danica]